MPSTAPNLSAHPTISSLASFFASINNRLLCSEMCLAQLLKANGLWPSTQPLPPAPSNWATVGSLEFGVFLFLLNKPSYIISTDMKIFADAYTLAASYEDEPLPNTSLTIQQYQDLETAELIGPDGEVAGTGTFELYDQGWLAALANLWESIYHNNVYNGGQLPLPPTPYNPIVVGNSTSGSQVTVALLGDWGTGAAAAASVMNQVVQATPDCIVHVGDVYYSGTPADTEIYYSPGEELNHLVNVWPTGFAGRSFALNSNHEMYSGATGLFLDALTSNSPFSGQGQYSVFALQIADWTILGLDSAFNSDPLGLYMYGMLDLPDSTAQQDWIRSLNLDPSKVIVLTHHNGFDPNCAAEPQSMYAPFWNQVRAALGGDPYAWYWGHVHNGIVYASPLTIPAYGSQSPEFTTDTWCRCLGHGALPYGKATDLNNPQITWQVASESCASDGNLLYNGFATLVFEIGEDGTCSQITENWFSANPNQTCQMSMLLFSSTAKR